MSPKLKEFFQRWIICTVAVLVASRIVKGIHCDALPDLLVATLVLGLLNAFLRPVLMLLSLPLLIVTLGLFTLVINALLLLLVDWMLGSTFRVDGFGAALWGAVVIWLVSTALNILTGTSRARVTLRRGRPRSPPKGPSDSGSGPVIDV